MPRLLYIQKCVHNTDRISDIRVWNIERQLYHKFSHNFPQVNVISLMCAFKWKNNVIKQCAESMPELHR